MKLTEIERLLSAELETAYEPATPERNLDRLLVLLPSEDEDDLVLELVYIPGLTQDLESARLLQFFITLPNPVPERLQSDICKLLSKININIPLPAFGFHQADSLAYFKYMALIPLTDSEAVKESAANVLMETVWLIAYQLNLFYPKIKSVATGQQTLAEATLS